MQLQKGEKEQNKDTNDHQNPTQQQMYTKWQQRHNITKKKH